MKDKLKHGKKRDHVTAAATAASQSQQSQVDEGSITTNCGELQVIASKPSEPAKAKVRRMSIPAELKVKANEIFAAQPAIASYIRVAQQTRRMSVEEYFVCLTYERLQDLLARLPILTVTELQAK